MKTLLTALTLLAICLAVEPASYWLMSVSDPPSMSRSEAARMEAYKTECMAANGGMQEVRTWKQAQASE